MSKKKSESKIVSNKKSNELTSRSKKNKTQSNKSKNKKNKKQKEKEKHVVVDIDEEEHSEEQQALDTDEEEHTEEQQVLDSDEQQQNIDEENDGKEQVEGKKDPAVSSDASRSTVKKIFILIFKFLLLLLLIYTVYTYITLLFVSLFNELPRNGQRNIQNFCKPYITKIKNAAAPVTVRIQSILNLLFNNTPWLFVKGKIGKCESWYMEKLNNQVNLVSAKKGIYVYAAKVLKTMNPRSGRRGYDNIIRLFVDATRWCLVSVFNLYWFLVKYFVKLGYY